MADGGNQIEAKDGIVTVVVDETSCGSLWTEIEPLLDDNRKIVLDFQNVTYLNSMSIAGIISLRNKIEQEGGGMALCGLKDQIVSIFRILKLERMFTLDLDHAGAVSALDDKAS